MSSSITRASQRSQPLHFKCQAPSTHVAHSRGSRAHRHYCVLLHYPPPQAHTLPPACSALTSLQPPPPPQGRLPGAWRPEGDAALRTTRAQHTDLLPRPAAQAPDTNPVWTWVQARLPCPSLAGPHLGERARSVHTPAQVHRGTRDAQRLRRGTVGGLVLHAPPPGQPGMKHPGSRHFIPSSHRFRSSVSSLSPL